MKFKCEEIVREEDFKVFWKGEYEFIHVIENKVELMVKCDRILHIRFNLDDLKKTGEMKIHLIEDDESIRVYDIQNTEELARRLYPKARSRVMAKTIAQAIQIYERESNY